MYICAAFKEFSFLWVCEKLESQSLVFSITDLINGND